MSVKHCEMLLKCLYFFVRCSIPSGLVELLLLFSTGCTRGYLQFDRFAVG